MKKERKSINKIKIISILAIVIIVAEIIIPIIGNINLIKIVNAEDSVTLAKIETTYVEHWNDKGYNTVTKVNGITYRNYSQKGGAYANEPFNGNAMYSDGCGPTSCAILLSGYGKDTGPWDLGKWIMDEYEAGRLGSTLGSNVLTAVLQKEGIVTTKANTSDVGLETAIKEIKNTLLAGRPVLLGTNIYPSGHWVCAIGVTNNGQDLIYSDPANSSNEYEPEVVNLESFVTTYMTGATYIMPVKKPSDFLSNVTIDEDLYNFFYFTVYESGTVDIPGQGPENVGAFRPGVEYGAGICQWTTMDGCNNIEYLCRRLYEKDPELCAPLQKYIGKEVAEIIKECSEPSVENSRLRQDFAAIAEVDKERFWFLQMEIAYEDFMDKFDELGLSWMKDRPSVVQGTLASLLNWGPYLGWEDAIDSSMNDEEIIVALCKYACGFTSTVGSLNHRWNPQAKLAIDILEEKTNAEDVLKNTNVAAKYSGTYQDFLSNYNLEYNITYNLNGGKDNGNKISYNCLTETFSLNEPSREGYTFIGWTGTGLTEATKEVIIEKGSTGNREYTANWQANTYTVRFNKNGGTGTMEDQAMTYGTKTKLRANSYTREGYTFDGWNTEADGTGTSYTDKKEVAVMTSESGATVTLYAQWKGNNYTVRFNANGGTGEMKDQAMTYGTKTELRANSYTREGYTFTGWDTEADGTGTGYTDRKEVAVMTSENGATVTLYAQWKKNPENTVNYKIQHYKEELNGEYTLADEETKQDTIGKEVTAAEKEYTGFSSLANNTKTITLSKTESENIIKLYYTRNSYKLTLAKNGNIEKVTLNGKEVTTAQDVKYGEQVTIKAELKSQNGYEFAWDKWTISGKEITDAKQEQTIEMPAQNVTITANATKTPITYNIRYTLNEGSLENGKTNPQTYNVETQNITLNNPVREGYTFKGWTGTGLTEATKTVTISKGSTGNRTYTANWEKVADENVNGDISGDGKTNITDLLLLKRHMLSGTKESWKLTGNKFRAADLNGDGNVNITDLLLLKRLILKK